MFRPILNTSIAVFLLSNAAFAQTAVPADTAQQQIDCDDPNNADDDECLGLPVGGDTITNFVPLIAPLLGVGAVAAAVAGGGGGDTTSTVSTTN